MGLKIDEQKAVERFRATVVEPSMTKLVILDFWAEWCGPCKALTPLLEKIAAEYADKGVVLAKVNVDEDQFIAAQFQVRSIPTVYAMFQGQPVADLTQARSETQLKQVLDQLLTQLPVEAGAYGQESAAPDVGPLLAMGEEVLATGDAERAMGIFTQIVDMAPENPTAHAGLLRAMVEAGQVAEADAALAALPEDVRKDAAVERAAVAIELAKNRPDDSELENLRMAAAERPADMDAQIAFANAAFASGQRDIAADTLLKMIQNEPDWNDGAAKSTLLKIFEAVGMEDPWVSATRRRLSLILFG
ncbi:tetratricopeptide repeat protein [Croceicoccus ponticola]|uniref:Tetratricopeptide repeat protein n=1 Tax=Croceicoccus ponticola TaxID=2217664 RepID=A0A437GX12_9SPHN|nr:tetratricopeptide repeat protein [Croceicoccus ponticola]RVQ66932.1 tetratricopeptide repeat protein [Croceicoccus ponticola]